MDTEVVKPIVVNGRTYPMWSQFIEKKKEWIGGVLEDLDMGMSLKTVITDITLLPNGEESAMFHVRGRDFNCGFDVKYGGIGANAPGFQGLTFSGYGGHEWRILKPRHNQ